jgi:hypothetical protein
MAEITEQQTILPVQPSRPGRRPGQRRQPPQRPDEERAQDKPRREPGSDDGRVVDEYA